MKARNRSTIFQNSPLKQFIMRTLIHPMNNQQVQDTDRFQTEWLTMNAHKEVWRYLVVEVDGVYADPPEGITIGFVGDSVPQKLGIQS